MYYREGRGIIKLADCVDGRLYRVDTRNFGPVSVFSAKDGGFIGLRRKFDQIRLDTEYHYEQPSFATAWPWEELPESIPSYLELTCHFDTVCKNCNLPLEYYSNKTRTVDGPWPGFWQHLPEIGCLEPSPVAYSNKPLKDWLKKMEEKYLGPPDFRPEWLDLEWTDEDS